MASAPNHENRRQRTYGKKRTRYDHNRNHHVVTATLLAVLIMAVAAGSVVWVVTSRRLNEPAGCSFSGCRRVSTTSVWADHPAAGTSIRLCAAHAARWQAEPYDQELDVSELERGLES